MVVTTEFLVPTLRYNLLDTTGAVNTAGSYAFLTTAGDATSAIGEYVYSPGAGTELRIHPSDATAVSRAVFYNAVAVGDAFDFQVNGVDCGYRFKVTAVNAAASPRVFGIAMVRQYGGRCLESSNPTASNDVAFVWKVLPGLVGSDEIRTLLKEEQAGPGTYRIYRGVDYTIQIPAGAQVIVTGLYSDDRGSGQAVVVQDVATGSQLAIDPASGAELVRVSLSNEADALFDHIMASIRHVE